MKPRYLILIVALVALNVFQSSAQSSLKTASPGIYPAINQLPKQHKGLPASHTPVNVNAGARTTKVSPLTMEVFASYSKASSSYDALDSSLYIYSRGRGYDAKSRTYLFDKYYTWAYIPYLGSLRYKDKVLQAYDASNNVLTEINQQWDTTTSSWINSERFAYTYDALNNLITDTSQSWNTSSSNWSEYFSDTYTYDASGNMLTRKGEVWDGSSSAWVNYELQTYTYDSHNNLLKVIYQDTAKGTWVNYYQRTYTYNTSNDETSEVNQTWNVTSSSWQNTDKYTYTYSGTNKVLSEVYQSWDMPSLSWFNIAQYTYTYSTSDDPVIELVQTGSGSSWQNSYRNLENFNSTHDDTDIVFQSWSISKSFWFNDVEEKITYDANHDSLIDISIAWVTDSSFVYNRRHSYTYNSNYQILTETEDEWNTGGNWNPVDGNFQYRYYYDSGNYYDTSTAVNNINKGGVVKVYPIPANDVMNIDLSWDTHQPAVATICNMQGVLCRQWQIPAGGSTHHSVPVAQLPAGSYILKITGEKGQSTQRISIIH